MTERVRIYEVGPRDGLQNEATPDPDRDQGAVHRPARRRRPARDRGDQLRRAERDPATRRCRRADARSRARAGRPLPGPRPERARPGPGRGRRRRRHRGLHRRDRCVHDGEHRDDRRRVAGRLRAGPGSRGRARLVAARLRLDRVRLPVHRARRARAGRRGRPAPARARRRRGLLRRHDRGRRAGPGRDPDRDGRGGRHPARAHRVPLPRHPRDGAGQRRGRPRCRRSLLRLVGRRDRRLPVRAGRRRQSRHGGPRLLPRCVGLGDRRRLARRRPDRGPLHRRRARAAARDARSARPAAGIPPRGPRPAAPDRQRRDARARTTRHVPDVLLSSARWTVSCSF